MRSFVRLIAIIAALASSVALAQQSDVSQTQQTQPQAAQIQPAAEATAQPATIVFYRPGAFYGKALKPSIYVDGKEVGRLKNGKYISYQTTTGKHSLASSKKDTAVEVTLTRGQPQYVEMLIQSGTWRGAGRLIPVPADEGKRKAEELKSQQD